MTDKQKSDAKKLASKTCTRCNGSGIEIVAKSEVECMCVIYKMRDNERFISNLSQSLAY